MVSDGDRQWIADKLGCEFLMDWLYKYSCS